MMQILTDIKIIGYYLLFGILTTTLVSFLLYVAIIRIYTLTIFDRLNETAKLLSIYTILLLLTIAFSLLFTFLLSEVSDKTIHMRLVFPSALFSFLFTIVIISILAYGVLFIYYPNFFLGIVGIEFFYIYPSVLVNFSIFILNHEFGIILLFTLTYYIIFLLFLEFFT